MEIRYNTPRLGNGCYTIYNTETRVAIGYRADGTIRYQAFKSEADQKHNLARGVWTIDPAYTLPEGF